MTKNTWRALVRYLGRSTHPVGSQDDGELLDQFVRLGEQTAFAMLTHRYGPMVFGVCRRVLGDAHDAEDAFQATFLILFRKATALGRPASIANWLYTVATHVALRAKATAGRRREQERHVAAMVQVETLENHECRDLHLVLDEELCHLAPKYREPLVLCYLQGKTNEEAAQHLHCPVGTIYTRLSRGRDLLRDRLARRGVLLSVGLVGPVLAEQAQARVPAALLEATIQAVTTVATGAAPMPAAVSPQVLELLDGVLQAMWVARILKLALFAASALLLTGSGWFMHRAVAVRPSASLDPSPIASMPSAPTGAAVGDDLVAVPGNVALAANGVRVHGIEHGAVHLNDGRVTGLQRHASSPWPCEWTIELPRLYPLTTVRLLLWDGNDRFYRYIVEASADGEKYEVLADRSTGRWRSWQTISFASRPVKFLKVRGLYNSENGSFHLKELEAYCIPPERPAEPVFPSEP